MTTISNLEAVKDWLLKNVCSNVKFKKPDDEQVGAGYKYELVNPDVHILYLPTKDTKQDLKPIVPSICVQFEDGADYLIQKSGVLNFRLQFATWDPGLHVNGEFSRNAEGWRDVWNFVDTVKDAIENTEFMGNIRVRKEDGIKYGPLADQGIIADFYPYWFAYLCFSGEFSKASTKKIYSNLL